jgi:hypothetical protein
LGDLLKLRVEFGNFGLVHPMATSQEFEQRDALLDGTAGDDKEVLPIRLREAAIAFGDVSFNGQSSEIALIDEEAVAS